MAAMWRKATLEPRSWVPQKYEDLDRVKYPTFFMVIDNQQATNSVHNIFYMLRINVGTKQKLRSCLKSEMSVCDLNQWKFYYWSTF